MALWHRCTLCVIWGQLYTYWLINLIEQHPTLQHKADQSPIGSRFGADACHVAQVRRNQEKNWHNEDSDGSHFFFPEALDRDLLLELDAEVFPHRILTSLLVSTWSYISQEGASNDWCKKGSVCFLCLRRTCAASAKGIKGFLNQLKWATALFLLFLSPTLCRIKALLCAVSRFLWFLFKDSSTFTVPMDSWDP